MLLSVLDYSDTASISSTSHHDYIPNIKFDEISDLATLQVQLDGVIGLDERVWVADGSPIMGVEVWDALLPKLHRPDFAELKLQRDIQLIRIILAGSIITLASKDPYNIAIQNCEARQMMLQLHLLCTRR